MALRRGRRRLGDLEDASPAPSTQVTVILVTYNSARLIQRVLESLAHALRSVSFECIVVDNASRDDTLRELERHAGQSVVIRNTTNVGFARANNQALRRARGKYILLVNPDAVLPENALSETLAFMESHPRCGILGVKLVGPDGSLRPSCRYFPTPFNLFVQRAGLARLFPRTRLPEDLNWDHAAVRQCDWVTGCFYLMRRQLVEQIGSFDPRYFLYYEEVDHCLAARRAGWEVTFFPGVTVEHVGGESARSDARLTEHGQIRELALESELLYFRKNHGRLAVWTHVLLMTAAAGIVACKRMVRRRSLDHLRQRWGDSVLLWSTFRRTGWATQPTR